MKKTLIILLALLTLILVSCATTKGTDIPDAVKETEIEPA